MNHDDNDSGDLLWLCCWMAVVVLGQKEPEGITREKTSSSVARCQPINSVLSKLMVANKLILMHKEQGGISTSTNQHRMEEREQRLSFHCLFGLIENGRGNGRFVFRPKSPFNILPTWWLLHSVAHHPTKPSSQDSLQVSNCDKF